MPWWRKLLALLGLTEDARVRVRAPGIEVVITGDPDLAKSVLSVVKQEIARQTSKRRGDAVAQPSRGPAALVAPAAPGRPSGPAAAGGTSAKRKKAGHSQVVRPSDLDEMDSPYAIPEHVPMEEASETPAEGFGSERTVNVDGMIEDVRDDDEPEPEPTAVDVAGPQASLQPTLVPEIAPAPRAASRVQAPKVLLGRRIKDPTETD